MLDYRWSVEFTDIHSSQVRLVGQSQSSLIHCYDRQSHILAHNNYVFHGI